MLRIAVRRKLIASSQTALREWHTLTADMKQPARDEMVELMMMAALGENWKEIKALKNENAALKQAIEELKQDRMKYAGVWLPKKPYIAGDVVTHHGSMWVASALTYEMPGNGTAAWTLAVKRGRDGKDAQ